MTIAAEERLFPRLGRSAETELERLYDRHAAEVRRYVQMVLRSRNDSEDVVQQTFLKALRALQRGVRPETPRQWLFTIAHNECRMLFRRAARRPVEVDLDAAWELGAREDSGVSAEAIREALGHLAPNQRAALVMRELEDRSYAEIAETLGLSESAVETLLFRARRAMREQIESHEGGCDDAQLLIAADSLDDPARKRLRAHVRTCGPCATLERRRRGKLAAAARKVAGLFPTPSWLSSLFGGSGAKAVVAIAVAAVAATGAVEAAKPDSTKPKPASAQRELHHDLVPQAESPQFASSLVQLGAVQGRRGSAAAPAVRKTGGAVAKPSALGVLTAGGKTDASSTPHARVLPLDDSFSASSQAARPRQQPAQRASGTGTSVAVEPATAENKPTARRPLRRLGPTALLAIERPSLPSLPPVPVPLPRVDPPQAPALSPPSLPEPPAFAQPQEAPAAALPAAPQLPPAPPLPSVEVPAVPPAPAPVPTPAPPVLTKP